MSSATVFFLLEELARQAAAGEHCIALGFGPGLMLEGLLLTAT
jgi:predicted naringenin-chalcone synthase